MKAGSKTRDKILRAALSLFAELGINGVSLRSIIQKAKVNQAAINYHFNNKEGVYEALMQQCAGELSAQRTALLDAAIAKYGSGKLPIEVIVRCFVEPFIMLVNQPDGLAYAKLIARYASGPKAVNVGNFKKYFEETHRLFIGQMEQAFPDLSHETICRAQGLLVALMTRAVDDVSFEILAGKPSITKSTEVNALVDLIVLYAAHGFKSLARLEPKSQPVPNTRAH